MAYSIHDSVIRGEIENTRAGVVTGRIWVVGRDDPLELQLAGDCWRDLAGRRLKFVNANPMEDKDCDLAQKQTGEVGDITASRKVRIPDLPTKEWHARNKQGPQAPEHWGNALYLEWYSDANGRVVIESADYQLEISLPEWEMTESQERRQREMNGEAMTRFIDRLESALRPQPAIEVPEDREMDEHEWERFLRQCDARSERYGELLDKFMDHPDRERIVAKEMGWNHIIEALDARASSNMDENDWQDIAYDELEDDWQEPELDPNTEGVDWIRTENGRVAHPLQHRCFELGITISNDAKQLGLLGPETKKPVDSVVLMEFNIHRASAKLAGALNSLASGHVSEPGFIVANLKRSLSLINEALAAISQVEEEGAMTEFIPEYRQETFEIRSGIIDLIERYRSG